MDDLITRLPKSELHVHLEGTISPATLWKLAESNHVALPVGTERELERLYDFKSFSDFIDLWLAMCACLRKPEDFERMVDGYLAECDGHSIRYSELHFTPYNHEITGFGGRRALELVTGRFEAAERSGGPVARLILDIPSEAANESGLYTIDLLEGEANPLVVALGLGGPEEGFPRRDFAELFARARRAGYAVVAHAGETGGADHVRQAVVDLGARRIQHGVRAAEDPSVMRLLSERSICCDVAISSNIRLKVYPDLASHPLKRLLSAGVPVTLSTDDPPFFGTSLSREWEIARDSFGLSIEEIWELNLNGLRYGFAETGVRRKLFREFEEAARSRGIASPSGSAGS